MQQRNDNKNFLKTLRVLIAAGSIGGFIGGWAMLAQASALSQAGALANSAITPTTVQVQTSGTQDSTFSVTPLTTTDTPTSGLTALPSTTTTNFGTTNTTASGSSFRTRLRTGGS